jgi:SEC-C motif
VAERLIDVRRAVRWWITSPRAVAELEGSSLREDPTICRLAADEIEANADLRSYITAEITPRDVLGYRALADGPFGRYRLAALFLLPPNRWHPPVLCLDGPRGLEASEHRNSPAELCLYFKDDPPERRWRLHDGLLRLFDLGRRHLVGEYLWRRDEAWPFEEAPHGGAATPATRNPALELPSRGRPGRNEPCTCGSGRKSKRCCWP